MEQFPTRVVNSNKIFRRLNGYWNGLWRSTEGNPNVDSIELTLLGAILPYLAVTHCDSTNDRFAFSYVGETLIDRFGVGIETGLLEESPSEEIREDLVAHLRSVVETKQPVVMAGCMKNSDVPFRHYECFTLPIAGDDHTKSVLITALTYAPSKQSTNQAA